MVAGEIGSILQKAPLYQLLGGCQAEIGVSSIWRRRLCEVMAALVKYLYAAEIAMGHPWV
jgi:hypothetical protein